MLRGRLPIAMPCHRHFLLVSLTNLTVSQSQCFAKPAGCECCMMLRGSACGLLCLYVTCCIALQSLPSTVHLGFSQEKGGTKHANFLTCLLQVLLDLYQLQRSFHYLWQHSQSASRIPGLAKLVAGSAKCHLRLGLCATSLLQICPLWRSMAGDGRWHAVRRECQPRNWRKQHGPACETVTWLPASPELDHHAGCGKNMKLAALKAAKGSWMFYWTLIVWYIRKRRKELLRGKIQVVSGEFN